MTLSGLRPSVLNVLYEYEKTFFVVRSGAMRRQERKLASSEAARLNIVPFPDIAQKVEIICIRDILLRFLWVLLNCFVSSYNSGHDAHDQGPRTQEGGDAGPA